MIVNHEVISPSTKQSLSLELVVVRNDNNIGSDMNGERVLLSIQNGKYYNLGTIGGRIWDLIERPEPIGFIVNTLLDEYDVERSICEAQVFGYLAHLSEERLVQFGV
ncbi:lasso peptide biosynthesis PqqD family chaperone [Paenibacillus sp. PL2-23]|uniref:lasso peptide biosynthesis PqqD family chaperone n=1 Tax=Paenibacillus sp. PL2-23 TaxID=2100729 RepID=UPI0030FC459F